MSDELTFKITSVAVKTRARKLRVKWTVEEPVIIHAVTPKSEAKMLAQGLRFDIEYLIRAIICRHGHEDYTPE